MTKRCGRCKEEKANTDFYVYKSGVNKGKLHSYCRHCSTTYTRQQGRKMELKKPWLKKLRRIYQRCHWTKHHYHKKGIKTYLNSADIKFLWDRDNAGELEHPSIDRINSDGHYTLDNCRFIELKDNLPRWRKVLNEKL